MRYKFRMTPTSGGGGGGGFGTFVSQNTGNSTSATPTVTLGSTASAGDLIIIAVAADAYNTTPPTGFTESTGCGQEGFFGHYIWWKVAVGGETSVGYVIGSATVSTWACAIYSGLNASPYDTSNGQLVDTTDTTYTTPSITPTSGSRLIIASIAGAGFSSQSNTLGTWLNSFTERSDSNGILSSTTEVVGVAELIVTASGASYSSGATYSTGVETRSGIIIAFK